MPEKANSLADVLLNPVRMRIVQHLLLHQPSTTQEIGGYLADIPKASLYRHLKKLTDCGLVRVVSENRVRGTVERVYALDKTEDAGGDETQKRKRALESTMLTLLGELERCLSRGDADMARDRLTVQTATLPLTDGEFERFAREISLAYARVLDNKPDGKRKMRRVTFLVSPVTTDERGRTE